MYLRSLRVYGAGEPFDLEVLVVCLEEELGCPCRSLGIRWQMIPASLEDLSNCEELRYQPEALSVDSLHKSTRSIFEEHDGQLPPHSFSFVDPVLLASEGLVLAHIEDHRGADGKLEHEAFLEDSLDVIYPSNLERIACVAWRSQMCNTVILEADLAS